MDYEEFLRKKQIKEVKAGFDIVWKPTFLFDFQAALIEWALKLGKAAIFADCGLGKGPCALVWSENVVRKTKGNVLILAPLAVARQFAREAEKFGIKVTVTQDGTVHKGINVTNYQRLHNFRPEDFDGVVCDESSILKSVDGKTRKEITAFLSKIPYRLLCTATPSPNDFMELGTSSEALGNMSRNQMLGMFFTNSGDTTQQWELKGHAKKRFWQWVSTWARAIRKPSDLGFDDSKFILPELRIHKHILKGGATEGFFVKEANTLDDQRKERKRSLKDRCEKVASLVPKSGSVLIWCQRNEEGDLLEKLIHDSIQVAGKDSDEVKEQRLNAFATGQERILISKAKIAGFGLNLQVCNTVFYFPDHSHESYYQAIRRCWRFGQKNPVDCHLVTTEVEKPVLDNMLRKEKQSVELYESVVRHMNDAIKQKEEKYDNKVKARLPSWL